MEIEFIYRNSQKQFSIEKVFHTIEEEVSHYSNVTVRESRVKPFRFWAFAVLWNMFAYAIKSRRNRLFHITGDVQYLGCLMNPKNTVLTIHDLVMLHDNSVPKKVKRLIYWLWYYIPLRRLKYITCISEATKKDLLQRFPWAERKITVIHNPVHPSYKFHPKEFDGRCPIILHIGTKPNKNLERTIMALKGVKCKLIIIGKLSQKQEQLLVENVIDYSNKIAISDEEMLSIYEKSDVVSFPSLFEGFGMPIIEGQAIGRPVLTSELEPMVTVANNAASLCDPTSVDSIRHGFMDIISSKNKYQEYVKNGLENAARYSVRAIAFQYLELYQSIEKTNII